MGTPLAQPANEKLWLNPKATERFKIKDIGKGEEYETGFAVTDAEACLRTIRGWRRKWVEIVYVYDTQLIECIVRDLHDHAPKNVFQDNWTVAEFKRLLEYRSAAGGTPMVRFQRVIERGKPDVIMLGTKGPELARPHHDISVKEEAKTKPKMTDYILPLQRLARPGGAELADGCTTFQRTRYTAHRPKNASVQTPKKIIIDAICIDPRSTEHLLVNETEWAMPPQKKWFAMEKPAFCGAPIDVSSDSVAAIHTQHRRGEQLSPQNRQLLEQWYAQTARVEIGRLLVC